MSSTTFFNNTGPAISAEWLNDVNANIYGPEAPAGTLRAVLASGEGAAEVKTSRGQTVEVELSRHQVQIDEVASRAPQITYGVDGYSEPVAYGAGLAMTLRTQVVNFNSQAYAPLPAALPFTTSGAFEVAKFQLVQGVAGINLLRPDGVLLVGNAADKRDLAASGGVLLVGNAADKRALLAAGGSGLVGYSASGVGAAAATIQVILRGQSVLLIGFTGADPTGATDSSAALANALASGKAVDLGGPENTWLFTVPVTRTGRVTLYGSGAKVKTNIVFLTVTDGSGSRVFGFDIYPATTPYTLKRNSATWVNVVGDVVQSLEGYIPSPLDTDLWAAIPAAYKTANAAIQTGMRFCVSSAAGGTDVEIHSIGGRQVSIVVEGYSFSSVHHCQCGAGQLTYGGIVFVNGVNRAYNSATLPYTLPRGVGNSAHSNNIRYATICGIVWFGNDGYSMHGNHASYCGESGLKLYQYDGAAGLSETVACVSTNGKIYGNTASDNYYDGIDAQALYGSVPFVYTYSGTIITGNTALRNRFTGITGNGASITATGNHANNNGCQGITMIGWAHTVVGNHARNNSLQGTALVPFTFDIVVQGDDCVSYGNNVWNTSAPSTFNYLHTGLVGADPTSGHEGLDYGNYCDQGPARSSVSINIPASKNGSLVTGNVRASGSVSGGGYLGASSPVSVSASAYTLGVNDSAISFYTSAACVLTLPAGFPGRILRLKNTNSFSITSASNNVGPIVGGAPSSPILAATAGKWCELQSDGTDWIIMASN